MFVSETSMMILAYSAPPLFVFALSFLARVKLAGQIMRWSSVYFAIMLNQHWLLSYDCAVFTDFAYSSCTSVPQRWIDIVNATLILNLVIYLLVMPIVLVGLVVTEMFARR